jgi:flagellum-specific peptidoglycan hydrolase FlgJ
MLPADFINKIKPAAIASSALTSIPVAFTIAEAALESGWGGSGLVGKANNLFGVKADTSWHGLTVAMPTQEFYKGTEITVPALWRAYLNWQASIDDHATFILTNPRYHAALALVDNAEAFTQAIAAAGYATDPDYATKIIEVMTAHNLEQIL